MLLRLGGTFLLDGGHMPHLKPLESDQPAYQHWRLCALATCSSNRVLLLLLWQLEIGS